MTDNISPYKYNTYITSTNKNTGDTFGSIQFPEITIGKTQSFIPKFILECDLELQFTFKSTRRSSNRCNSEPFFGVGMCGINCNPLMKCFNNISICFNNQTIIVNNNDDLVVFNEKIKNNIKNYNSSPDFRDKFMFYNTNKYYQDFELIGIKNLRKNPFTIDINDENNYIKRFDQLIDLTYNNQASTGNPGWGFTSGTLSWLNLFSNPGNPGLLSVSPIMKLSFKLREFILHPYLLKWDDNDKIDSIVKKIIVNLNCSRSDLNNVIFKSLTRIFGTGDHNFELNSLNIIFNSKPKLYYHVINNPSNKIQTKIEYDYLISDNVIYFQNNQPQITTINQLFNPIEIPQQKFKILPKYICLALFISSHNQRQFYDLDCACGIIENITLYLNNQQKLLDLDRNQLIEYFCIDQNIDVNISNSLQYILEYPGGNRATIANVKPDNNLINLNGSGAYYKFPLDKIFDIENIKVTDSYTFTGRVQFRSTASKFDLCTTDDPFTVIPFPARSYQLMYFPLYAQKTEFLANGSSYTKKY